MQLNEELIQTITNAVLSETGAGRLITSASPRHAFYGRKPVQEKQEMTPYADSSAGEAGNRPEGNCDRSGSCFPDRESTLPSAEFFLKKF